MVFVVEDLDEFAPIAQWIEQRSSEPKMRVRLPLGAQIMYTLYVLRSLKDGKLYIGVTNNFKRRYQEHNDGKSKSTRYRKPFRFVYKEEYKTRSEAMKREWFFKNTTEGNKLMRVLIKD